MVRGERESRDERADNGGSFFGLCLVSSDSKGALDVDSSSFEGSASCSGPGRDLIS